MLIYSLTGEGGGPVINLISVSNEVCLLINRLSELCQLSLSCHNSLIWTWAEERSSPRNRSPSTSRFASPSICLLWIIRVLFTSARTVSSKSLPLNFQCILSVLWPCCCCCCCGCCNNCTWIIAVKSEMILPLASGFWYPPRWLFVCV